MSAADKSKSVSVVVKRVYGCYTIYPASNCANAQRFALLTGKKTFDAKDIGLITGLGFVVTEQPDITLAEILK